MVERKEEEEEEEEEVEEGEEVVVNESVFTSLILQLWFSMSSGWCQSSETCNS